MNRVVAQNRAASGGGAAATAAATWLEEEMAEARDTAHAGVVARRPPHLRHNGHTKPVDPGLGGGAVTLDELLQAERFHEHATAPNTERGFAADLAHFASWCAERGVVSLPAEPKAVAAYLAWSARLIDEDGRLFYTPGTIARRLSSLNRAHEQAGHPRPGKDPYVKATMAGIRRVRKHQIDQKQALTVGELRDTLEIIDVHQWPGAVIGLRDRALLLTGFAGAFRRSELAALVISDVSVNGSFGFTIRVRASKTDQEAEGMVKAIPFGSDPGTCAPCAITRWVQVLREWQTGRANAIRYTREFDDTAHVCNQWANAAAAVGVDAPLFRPVLKNGVPKPRHISGNVVNDVLKRRLAAALGDQYNPSQWGAHSLRAGFITEALTGGATHHEVMRQTGQVDPRTVERYARERAPHLNNAVTKVGL